VARIAADTMAGDLLVTLGAGDVYQLGEAVLQNLGYATKTHEPA
jgi:UDP-N-acetylmuramate-alanine ligase